MKNIAPQKTKKNPQDLEFDCPKETQLESFNSIRKIKPNITQIILQILSEREMTTSEISAELYERGAISYQDRHYATPRINELMNTKQIIAVGKKVSAITRRQETVWKRV